MRVYIEGIDQQNSPKTILVSWCGAKPIFLTFDRNMIESSYKTQKNCNWHIDIGLMKQHMP